MVTLLFTSVFIIGILAVALYFWQKPRKSNDQAALAQPPQPRGLFAEPELEASVSPNSNQEETEKQQSLLMERARSGDKSTLEETHALGNREFYDQILNLLVVTADSAAGALSLVSYVARRELPVNRNLAQAAIDSWQKTPDRNSTAKALHIAALADDAEFYRSAVETALQYFRTGKLPDVTRLELQALFDGEFWVLSANTRNSGAGFVLKRTLANARRELGNTTSINQ